MSAWRSAPLVVGHRGGRGAGWPPENTMPAFERARREGARAVELDVRVCASGEAVVFHDPTLARMTAGRDARPVERVARFELQRVVLGGDGDGGAAIPTLDEVLAWARAHDVAVNVELKYDVPRLHDVARSAARSVRAAGADVLLSSFDPRLLAWAAIELPAVPRALITHVAQAKVVDALRALMRGPLVRAVGAVHLEAAEADPEAIARYRRRGLRVGVWTVNDPAVAARLAALGVGSIITDDPGAVVRAVAPSRANGVVGGVTDRR